MMWIKGLADENPISLTHQRRRRPSTSTGARPI